VLVLLVLVLPTVAAQARSSRSAPHCTCAFSLLCGLIQRRNNLCHSKPVRCTRQLPYLVQLHFSAAMFLAAPHIEHPAESSPIHIVQPQLLPIAFNEASAQYFVQHRTTHAQKKSVCLQSCQGIAIPALQWRRPFAVMLQCEQHSMA
jgi:hypothetical protein